MEQENDLQTVNRGEVLFAWRAREYEVRHKSADWYWALGILAIAGASAALLMGNALLAIIVLAGSFFFALAAAGVLPEIEVKVTSRGIQVGHDFYPYTSLEGYWIHTHPPHERVSSVLLLRPASLTSPLIAIPIADSIDILKLDEVLSSVLPPTEMSPPLIHKVLEWMGV